MNPIKKINDKLFSIFDIPSIILGQINHYEWKVFCGGEIVIVFNSKAFGYGLVDNTNDYIGNDFKVYRIYFDYDRYITHNENGYAVKIDEKSFYWYINGSMIFSVYKNRNDKFDDYTKINIKNYPNLLYGNPLPNWAKQKIKELL